MEGQVNNKLIAKNTIVLYLRMLFTLAVSLFTARELLRILGVEDFGLYNVVGGVVLMFGFLNSAMVASSQRFISFSLGEGDEIKQKKVFSTSILIHFTIALVILLLAETAGLWFLNNRMTIPDGRYDAVNWVYQAAIASFACQIIQVPFSASVIAHEKMTFYALISIVDACAKLGIVYVLAIFEVDKLRLYALLLLGISITNLILYIIFCRVRFCECRFSFHVDRSFYKEMLSFAGWSFIGNFGFTAKDYGVNIILNVFCGPMVNAARGIAYQVMNAVHGFVGNFQTAMNPQITKRYAIRDVESMVSLVKSGSRYSFYLLAIIIVPLFIRAEYVLHLWLDEVPDMTLQFLRLTLIMSLMNSMHGPLVTAMQATGKIKVFQITIASIMLMDLPMAYILLKLGFTPYSVMYVAIVTAFVGLIVRAVLLDRLIKIDLKDFILNVILRNLCLSALLFVPAALLSIFIPQTFWGLILFCSMSAIWSLLVIYSNLKNSERYFVKTKARAIMMKLNFKFNNER